MKSGLLVFISFWLFTNLLYSQFASNFSSGNLDEWQGDKSNFIVNPLFQLQLNAPTGSTSSWLYTPLTYTDSMTWDLYFNLDFAPSTSNQLRIFLGLTSSDPATSSGYFLEIGASGDQDMLEFKYRDHGNDITLATSVAAFVASQPVELKLRVVKKANAIWSFYAFAEETPELLFQTMHDALPLSGLHFFGLLCTYTDTRRDKFYFDDISIQPLYQDTVAPTCISMEVIDGMTVELGFDEPIDEATANVFSNYILNPGGTSPTSIEFQPSDILLHWDNPFISQLEYTLSIQHLKDISGNTMLPDEKTFTHIDIKPALPYELLITEIMADPTPVIGLPDAEYVELYNASSGVFNLADYKVVTGNSERKLPDSLINSHAYIILCDEEDANALSAYGRVAVVDNFSSLTNSGTTLVIKGQQDVVIHEVSYTNSWYGDPAKSAGGWSLEMINPEFVCTGMANWSAANNLVGGTPGLVNSGWVTTPDHDGPMFVTLFTSDPDKILLRFNEGLDPLLVENPSAYQVFPIIEILTAEVQDPESVELTLATPLQPEVIYHLLPFEIYDCKGNPSMSTDSIVFGLTVAPENGDVLINEILFNPASGGSRFLEVLNVSQKFIDLQPLAIARLKDGQNDIYTTGVSEILGPGELVAFSPEPSDILFRYQVPQPNSLFEAPLPTWNDLSDNVALLYNGEVIDSLTYSSDWHLPVIVDQNGVSLERISATSATSNASNWHSAASTAGYGTPTGVNSQNFNATSGGEIPFSIINKQFSPNEDGYKDFLALNFLLTSGNETGSVWIYDLEGREINHLIANETLGTSAIVQWDGRNADSVLADMGIYLIFVQLWDAQGNVKEYQETCALVKR